MHHLKPKQNLILFVVFCFLSCTQNPQQSLTFLRVQGHDMVDESGDKVLLRGVGLGNWLLPEGYMWRFGKDGDRPRKIETLISNMIGEEKAEQFWLEFRQNYITEVDIQRIADLGFNSVRPALNARRFLTEGDNPTYVDEGFELLDNLIAWCKKHNLYVIIDMHGAPGGQTGQNIDDSPNNLPELFMDVKNQDRLVDLWVKIAERYKDEPTVAAYDLLNEPLPARTGAAEKYKHLVLPLYKRITQAIRQVDKKHMITLEGVDWSNDWSIFTEPIDDNVFYQFHYYCWDRPDHLKSVQQYIDLREKLNAPVWVGETGEKGNAIYWGTTQYFEHNNIGWSFWPWKKMDAQNTPYSIKKPANWDVIREYSRGGDKPNSTLAQNALNELLENIKLANCEYYPDVVNAILRQAPVKVEAENYGHKGFNQSYFVHDTTQRSEFYRPREPVPIEVIPGAENDRTSEQYISMQKGEWATYEINTLEPQTFNLVVKTRAKHNSAAFKIMLNGQVLENKLTETNWVDIDAGKIELGQGINSLKLFVSRGVAHLDGFCFD